MARDVKLLIEFLRQKHEQRNPEDTKAKELNEYLFKFILSVKRKDGKDFEPLALRGLYSSFNRRLKGCKYPISVIDDVAFECKRKCLEAKNKQLKKKGKGNRPNAAEALSDDEINILYGKNLLGISNGEALINKPEVELIHLMSDRSNLKLLRLQIYRANEILLLFSRYILKRDQSP